SLADSAVNGEPYPWTLVQLKDHGVDNEALQRLQRCGWFVKTRDDRVQIFNDRLLNWAVAQALFSALQSNKRTPSDVFTQASEINKTEGRSGKLFLGYVA